MNYNEFLDKYNTNYLVTILYACFKALEENNEENNINMEEYINKALRDQKEYEDSKNVLDVLSQNNKNISIEDFWTNP